MEKLDTPSVQFWPGPQIVKKITFEKVLDFFSQISIIISVKGVRYLRGRAPNERNEKILKKFFKTP